jgi:hypothetical protein
LARSRARVGGQARAEAGGVGPVGDGVSVQLGRRVDPGAGVGAQLALLGAAVAAQQVVGDPIQPGSGVGPARVAPSAAQRLGEGLGGEVFGQGWPDPPVQVAVQPRVVLVEERCELFRFGASGQSGLRVGSFPPAPATSPNPHPGFRLRPYPSAGGLTFALRP